MGLRVFLAEKPKMGQVIAQALTNLTGQQPRRGDNCFIAEDWAVGWLAGHIFSLFDVKDYGEQWHQSWMTMPLPVIPSDFRYKPSEGEFYDKLRASVKKLLACADSVVIATDPGQEGQLIADIALRELGWRGKTERLWSSANNAASMLKAITNNIEDNESDKYKNLTACAYARSHCDWLIGINLTIRYTTLARKAGYDIVASAGRVQSALLAICVDHDEMVNQFKSRGYYDIEATLQASDGYAFKATLNIPESVKLVDGHCTDEAVMQQMLAQIQDKPAEVLSIHNNKKSTPPPEPFNLTTLSIRLSKDLGLSSNEVLEAYQKMYEAGLLTYPRTEDKYYEDEQLRNIRNTFSRLSRDPNLAKGISSADLSLTPAVFDSSQITEHPANSPTGELPSSWDKFPVHSYDIFLTVAKRLIAQFHAAYVTSTQTVTIKIAGYSLRATGRTILQNGWTQVDKTEENDDEIASLPVLQKGDSLQVTSCKVITKRTRAPARMTEAKLLAIMEDASDYLSAEIKSRFRGKAELGTAATRAAHIEHLVAKRRFLNRDKKGIITPTKVGKQVRQLLPIDLTSPDLTCVWETFFKKIKTGNIDYVSFLRQITAWLKDQLDKSKQLSIQQNPRSQACKCGSVLVRKESRRHKGLFFWACVEPACNTLIPDLDGRPVSPLPEDGSLCPICGNPFKTRVRKRDIKQARNEKNKERRYLMCTEGHFPSSKRKD